MKKWEELIDFLQKKDFKYVKELKDTIGKELGLIKEEPEKKKVNVWAIILTVAGAIAIMAGVAYAVYKFMTPDYLEGFEDDFDDDFEDDFFEDEDDEN